MHKPREYFALVDTLHKGKGKPDKVITVEAYVQPVPLPNGKLWKVAHYQQGNGWVAVDMESGAAICSGWSKQETQERVERLARSFYRNFLETPEAREIYQREYVEPFNRARHGSTAKGAAFMVILAAAMFLGGWADGVQLFLI